MTRIVGPLVPTIRFAYDAAKANELARHLLQLAGGNMPMLKLLKLMYLADRRSLIETGFTITGDAIFAMEKGPVLSKTYDALKPDGSMEGVESRPGDGVRLLEPAPADGALSDYEIGLAAEMYAAFGHKTGQQLITYLHREAPEWKPPPTGSSSPIDPAAILRAAGKSEDEIVAIANEAAYFRTIDQRILA